MFNKEFYPTPKEVIRQMLKGVDLKGKCILEPSAGKGDILDYITNDYNGKDANVYAIEQEPDLKAILHEKKYRVIGDDFLSYSGSYYFDLIVMNPPFSNGVDHLLKAWEILQDGQIICLLNSETIANQFSEKRQLLGRIIEEYGSSEDIGAVFMDAERSTRVNCSIVRLTKVAAEIPLDFNFESTQNKKHSFDFDENLLQNPIATRDIIGNMEKQYSDLQGAYVEYLKSVKRLYYYATDLVDRSHIDIKKMGDDCMSRKGNNRESFNNFLDATKQQIWASVISRTNIDKYMTASVKENFQKFSEQQGYMDFNKENVASLVSLVFGNRHNIMKQAITDVFTNFTKYYDENRCHVEGWKTNDKYKVNRKIILPYYIKFDDDWAKKGWGGRFSLNYSYREKLLDVDRVLCYITGENFDELRGDKENSNGIHSDGTITGALSRKFDIIGKINSGDQIDNTTESKFFNIKFFRKGTLHIEFKDAWVWQEFNMQACDGLNWLPEQDKKAWKKGEKPKAEPKPKKEKPQEPTAPAQVLFEFNF